MPMPDKPSIYHIVHVDRLASIISDDVLWCEQEVVDRKIGGTTIGMNSVKQRRLTELTLDSHPELYVGGCVPFYFCPRSVMLYLIHRANHPELDYRGGQNSIVHLEADLYDSVAQAEEDGRRWAFTLSNAGSRYCKFRCDLAQLDEIDWNAVQIDRWAGASVSPSVKEGKQAEFLVENSFPWRLVSRIGVHSQQLHDQVRTLLQASSHRPHVEIMPGWYY